MPSQPPAHNQLGILCNELRLHKTVSWDLVVEASWIRTKAGATSEWYQTTCDGARKRKRDGVPMIKDPRKVQGP